MGTILIADDHAANRYYLRTLLAYAGHRVLEACDGEEALQLVRDEHPDLAIIDLLMPKVDGYEFIRQLRRDPSIANTPVVFTSATYDALEARPLADACGVYEFLPKPAGPDQVLKVVASALGTSLENLPAIPQDHEREHRRLLTGKLLKSVAELEIANLRLDALARKAEERRELAEAAVVELRQAKTELEKANQYLLRSNDELRQLAYVASHDLQEPLRSITSFCDVLKAEYQGRLDEQADNHIERIVNGAKRMKALVTGLMSYAQIIHDEQPALSAVDFQQVASDALANLQMSIKESCAEVSLAELPVVPGDRAQLVQLLQNLIGNAMMYHGEQPPRIHINARKDRDHWEFAVRDNGIGIAPEHHQQIFEIFKRLHSRDKYPGTGIGLAVCKKIVQRHGGQIWVESQPGAGSVFRFTVRATVQEEVDERKKLIAASV